MWTKAVSMIDPLVKRAKNGDAGAFETLYVIYKCSVYALCLRLTRNVLDAEDLTQEVFLQVHRKVSSFRGEAAFGSWLYRVAINVTMMHLRKQRPEALPLDVLELPSCSKSSATQLESQPRGDPFARMALIRALGDLSKGRRTLVILHDLKGLTHREVAQRLGVTVNTSRSQLYAAHRKLRDMLARTDMRTYRQVKPCSVLQNVDLGCPNRDLTHQLASKTLNHSDFALSAGVVEK
jgi:RNA polymerase sigma-70 factor (ECF subfamily)